MSEKYVLLIIDSQKGIDEAEYWGGNRNNPDAEKNIVLILDLFRRSGLPVIHVQHCSNNSHSPLRPGQIGHAFKESNEPREEELVVQKTETDAFINTNLTDTILALDVERIVITGFITNNSVEATA
ncbi:MAG: isochorismatase family protein, partial [Cyclobacteriaceae bacterium]